ncbi:hypothetical protein [Treponema sp. R6D11]
MRRICFDPRFVDFEKSDLIEGKIHSIRQSYQFWKKFEGREVALFVWEGKPYRSKQKVFCVKKIVSVQKVVLFGQVMTEWGDKALPDYYVNKKEIPKYKIAENDGFETDDELDEWAFNHKWEDGIMAILHFTDFRY